MNNDIKPNKIKEIINNIKLNFEWKRFLLFLACIILAYLLISYFMQRGELRKYISSKYEVATITEIELRKIEVGMEYEEVLQILGKTKDIGFIKPTAKYKMGDKFLYVGFIYIHDKNETTPDGYIASLTYEDKN